MDKPLIGLLLVSHSLALAQAVETLVRQMTGERLQIGIAAGAGPARDELGTDPMAMPICSRSPVICRTSVSTACARAKL